MPDAPESTTPTTENENDTPDEVTEDVTSDDDDGALGEPGQKALKTERAARAAAEKSYKESQKSIADLTAKVKSYEDRDKSEAQLRDERIAELEKALADKDSELSKTEQEKLRVKVANREGKQVPVELLTGSTEEELTASADRLLEFRGDPPPSGPLRQQGFRSGAGAPPDGSTPKQTAAAALREMRRGA